MRVSYDAMTPCEDSDAVRACPDCDRPNQFGQLCGACERDRADEARQWYDDFDDADDYREHPEGE